jgi:arylsulfatase A-like enzyme
VAIDRVLVIISDTVRWDYLGYNGGTVRTPNIDALAARSTVFDRHMAASFPTVPTRYDYLTGKPAYVSVGWGRLPHEEYTAIQDIGDAGYATCGVVDTPFYQIQGYHYERAFRYFYDMRTQPVSSRDLFMEHETLSSAPISGKLIPEPRLREADHAAPQTMARAEDCLEYLYQRPFFTYVDTWDPHEPWDAPPYYVRRYFPEYSGEQLYPPYGRWRELGLTERDIALSRGLYSGKLEMVDRWIGRLLDKVQRLGIADRTAIIFMSDHGFLLGEHGILGKLLKPTPRARTWMRSPLYEELIHVPLIVHIPGEGPRRCDSLTWALDVAPTLLDLVGLRPRPHMVGRSLLPAVYGEPLAGHNLVVSAVPLADVGDTVRVVDGYPREISEWQPVTITDPEWSLLYSIPSEPVELFHLPSDPEQAHDVAAQHRDVVARLIDGFVVHLKRVGASPAHIARRTPPA